jgi:hypothetical protein
MKKGLFLGAAFLALSLALVYTIKQNKDMRKKWETAMANVKAYSNELDASKKHNIAFQLTIDQLKTYQDSILKDLDNTRKELKIKDKDLKALQAVKSSFTRTDTIRVTQVDTLFKEPSFALDTIIGDDWYNLQLGLKYPSTIAIKPYFKSEKHIIVSSKKETVNPPKKFFLLRWFQKKHRVLNIDVVEKNPYVENESTRFVEIVK